MPDIASVSNSVGPLHSTPGAGREGIERPASRGTSGLTALARQDRVEVSRHAEWFQALREMPDIRQDRVEAVQNGNPGRCLRDAGEDRRRHRRPPPGCTWLRSPL